MKINRIKPSTQLLISFSLLLQTFSSCTSPSNQSFLTPKPNKAKENNSTTVPVETTSSIKTVVPNVEQSDIDQKCPVLIKDDLRSNYQGTVVFNPFQDPQFYNLETDTVQSLPPGKIDNWWAIGSSPDRKWFYYHSNPIKPNSVEDAWITNSTLKKRFHFDTPSFVIRSYWINSEVIYFETVDHKIILLNLLTMNMNKWEPRVTDLYNLEPQAYWSYAIDPSMKLFLYPPTSNNGHFRYVLYNPAIGKVIWERNNDSAPFKSPKWSPEGEFFIIITHDDDSHDALLKVDEEGQESKLTNFIDIYPLSYIYNFSVSPDGKRVAFWLDIRNSFHEVSKKSLFIIDIDTLKNSRYCITTINDNGEAPIWSPDSKNLILSVYDEYDTRRNLLIDLIRNIYFELPQNWQPIDWLTDQ